MTHEAIYSRHILSGRRTAPSGRVSRVLYRLGLMYFLIAFYFVLIGKANDWLDYKIYRKHERKYLTHSPYSPLFILIATISGLLFGMLNIFLGVYMVFIVYIILASHSILEALNPSGIPLSRKGEKFHVKKTVPYDSLKWNLLISIIGAAMIVIATLIFSVFR